MATYELKPRLNRLDGVATVVVQGGQEPEFHITPDPAKLLTTGVTVSDILGRVRRTNLIDSPGLLEAESSALSRTRQRTGHRHEAASGKSSSRARRRAFRCGSAMSRTIGPRAKPVYTVVTANGKPGHSVEHQPPARQQHARGRQRSARRDRAHPQDRFPRASRSRPFTISRTS